MSEGRKPRNKNLTVPNAMSVFRIVIIPFFVWAFFEEELVLAVLVLALSALSDAFDGMVARRFNQITELGKILDPFADKLTQATVAICLAVKLPIILPVLAIFIVKELGMLVCAVVLLRKKKAPCAAKWYGKVATVLFYIAVGGIVVMNSFLNVPSPTFEIVSYALLLATAVMMIYSAVKYFKIFLDTLKSEDGEYKLDISEEIHAKV